MPRAVVLSSGDESSDESSDGGPGENHVSKVQSSGSSSSSGGSGSDRDDDDSDIGRRSNFLDVEADESDDDSVDGPNVESDSDAEPGDEASRHSFTQFMLLPPELRSRVWELFCPDLVTRARFLQFDLAPASAAAVLRSSRPNMWTVRDTYLLACQIESLHRLMATHRESRKMGSRAFPDTLAIDAGDGKCDGIVRFNKHRDIVFLDGVDHLRHGHLCHLPGFAKHVANVVVRSWVSPTDQWAGARIRAALRLFPNMQRLYLKFTQYELKKKDLRWTVSDCVHQYLMETFEEEHGLGEDTQSVACWPDVHGHPDFARFQIPPIHVRGRPAEIDRLVESRGIRLWPLVTFELGIGMMRYRKILQLKDIPYHDGLDDDSSSDDSSSSNWPSFGGSRQDEYESTGIDDDDIIQDDDSSEDELIADQLSDGSPSAREPSGGRFSSPELETDNEANGVAEADMQRRPPKRRIVTDSDDDDSSAPDEPRAKRPRMSRPTAADSDDESDSAPEQKRRKRSLDTSGSESDHHSGGAQVHPEDSAASSSDDDWDADPPQLRMSLAQRLQAHGEAYPIPPSDDEGSPAEKEDDDEDDDSADEDDDEDDDSADEDGGGLIDGMASESDGEGDGSEGEW